MQASHRDPDLYKGPTLVIIPPNLLGQWQEHTAAFGLSWLTLRSTKRHNKALQRLARLAARAARRSGDAAGRLDETDASNNDGRGDDKIEEIKEEEEPSVDLSTLSEACRQLHMRGLSYECKPCAPGRQVDGGPESFATGSFSSVESAVDTAAYSTYDVVLLTFQDMKVWMKLAD